MMDWTKLLAMNRYLSEAPATKKYPKLPRKLVEDEFEDHSERSVFCRDTDKILFSSSFRRLGRKTQVHPLNDNDHIHTRSTHSLEVASVGRGIARRIAKWLKHEYKGKKTWKLPNEYHFYRKGILHPSGHKVQIEDIGEIVFAACLAHDLGNPPFGHAGEQVIGKWFEDRMNDPDQKFKLLKELLTSESKQDFTKYDGNAMAFRIVTKIEERQYNGGLKLTLPVLGTMLKYPWKSAIQQGEEVKFSAFKTEIEDLNCIAENLGLRSIGESNYARHPLAHIVEIADDICYNIMDLEDAFELKIIDGDLLIKELIKVYGDRSFLYKRYPILRSKSYSKRRKIRLLRAWIINQSSTDAVCCFKENYNSIMEGEEQFKLGKNVEENTVLYRLLNLYKKRKKEIYNSRMKLMLEIGAYALISDLLSVFFQAITEMKENPKKLSFFAQRISAMCKDHFSNDKVSHIELHEALILVLDYLAGMSDHYARDVHEMFLGLGRAR